MIPTLRSRLAAARTVTGHRPASLNAMQCLQHPATSHHTPTLPPSNRVHFLTLVCTVNFVTARPEGSRKSHARGDVNTALQSYADRRRARTCQRDVHRPRRVFCAVKIHLFVSKKPFSVQCSGFGVYTTVSAISRLLCGSIEVLFLV